MKSTAIPVLTVGTIIGIVAFGPWFLLVGLAAAVVGGAIEEHRS